MAERLQRYLARAGVASRRHAEELITAGRVTVNNQLTNTLGSKVEPGDLVALDGKLVMPPDTVSWYVLYKPAGVVTTLDDPQGRPTVRTFLESVKTRVFPIGRLDWDAEGALLLTDDGAAAHRLLHPSFQVPRTYLAKVKGVPTEEGLARLLAGVRLEDGLARALEVERFSSAERNSWLRVTVGEGRPHLVKRLCAAIGHPVLRLYRPHQAGISVAGMQPGELRPLRPEELAVVEAVAAGQPVPAVTLGLPPRRHGRANDDAEPAGDGGEEAGEVAPPRKTGAAATGFRPRPGGARGASPGRGPPREGRPVGEGGGWPRARPGLQRGGPHGAGAPSGRAPEAGYGFRGKSSGGPGARAGFQHSKAAGRGAPRGRPEDGGGGFRAKAAAGAWGGARRGPPGGRPGFQHPGGPSRGASPGRNEGGGGFRGKPAAAFGGPGRRPSGGRPGFQQAGGPSRGASPGRNEGGGGFRGKPAVAFGGPGRRPAGGRPGFQHAGGPSRGASPGRSASGGGFRGKPAAAFGGPGGRRPPGGRPGFQHAGGPGRGAPAGGTAGGSRGKPSAGGFSGGRRGLPGSRPAGERGAAPGRVSRPAAAKGGSWRAPRGAPRGRPSEGGRGPLRPAGGKPRAPRR